jgi:hypothetical protein
MERQTSVVSADTSVASPIQNERTEEGGASAVAVSNAPRLKNRLAEFFGSSYAAITEFWKVNKTVSRILLLNIN